MTTTFESLGVSAPLVSALSDRGIVEPFAIQALTIADALAGREVRWAGGSGVAQGIDGAGRLVVARTARTRPRAGAAGARRPPGPVVRPVPDPGC